MTFQQRTNLQRQVWSPGLLVLPPCSSRHTDTRPSPPSERAWWLSFSLKLNGCDACHHAQAKAMACQSCTTWCLVEVNRMEAYILRPQLSWEVPRDTTGLCQNYGEELQDIKQIKINQSHYEQNNWPEDPSTKKLATGNGTSVFNLGSG